MNTNQTVSAYTPIPLEERLRRYAAGETGSPHYVRCILRDYSRLALIPTMEHMNYVPERPRVHRALKTLHASGPSECLTLGELALLISKNYGKARTTAQTQALSSLICSSFVCLEVYCALREKAYFSRDSFGCGYQVVYDYSRLTLKDIEPYMSEKGSVSIRAFLRQAGCSGSMQLWKLFQELLRHAGLPADGSLFDTAGGIGPTGSLATAEAMRPLIELFIFPIAALQLRSGTDGARDEGTPVPGRSPRHVREDAALSTNTDN